MKRMLKGTITRHRGYWCLRYREHIREGDTIQTVQRSKRLAPVDAMHKTRRSVEPLAEALLEPINKTPALYVAMRLGDFVGTRLLSPSSNQSEDHYLPRLQTDVAALLEPTCANWLMHDVETRTIQTVLDKSSSEDKVGPQTMAHIKHLLGGIFHFAIAQDHLPKGTINPVTFSRDSGGSRFRWASLHP